MAKLSRQRKAPGWLFGWADGFTDSWGALPAEPILYFFMLTGILQIIITPVAAATVTHTPVSISDTWRVSSLVAPVLCLLAWWMIHKSSGRIRLAGLWVRLAGDVSQLCSLTVFLVIRLTYTPINDDVHVYLMHVMMGVAAFVLMLVLRDLWILLRVEEIASHLERLSSAGIDPRET